MILRKIISGGSYGKSDDSDTIYSQFDQFFDSEENRTYIINNHKKLLT
jgi:hypothetical protein